MEKPAKRIRKNIAGLLILFLSAGLSLHAKPVSWAYLWGMRFRPAQDTLFTENDNSFFVEIENVTPDSVQISVNSLPPNVSFVSSKKETVLIPRDESQGGGYATGTRIILWMRFTKTGVFKIKPIDLTIDGGFYQIPFETVEVFQNPRFIHPEINIVFQNQNLESTKNGKKPMKINAGDHVVFTVTARYMESIQNIFWNIPENSIFKKIRDFEFKSTSDEKKFITQFQSVAAFDWQPLSEGPQTLPEIFITATSYDGSLEDIQCPVFKFNAGKAQEIMARNEEENPFVYAFYETEKPSVEKRNVEAKPQEIISLFELHKAERHSLPFSGVTAARKKAEVALGLPCEYHEPSVVLLMVMTVFCILVFGGIVVFLILKKKTFTAVFASVFILSAVFTGIYAVHVKSQRGIFTGGEMSPIPEYNMVSGVTIQAGSVVSIIRTAGEWMYIKHNDTYGWIPSKNVCLIK
ncbi:MAG: YrzE family protein [Treponema sp.]|nr:YrzE family protein [Candidatus Treponema equi]